MRPRKTEIGTEVAHVTPDSHHFQGQRSKSPGRFTHRGVYASGSNSGDCGNVFTMGTYCYIVVRCCRLGGASAPTEGGEGRGHIVVASAHFVLNCFDAYSGNQKLPAS